MDARRTSQSVTPGEHNLQRYSEMVGAPTPAPHGWAASCSHDECTLHQLSPYIGKLKSSIARDLILRFSAPGDLIIDPFCGSGTVALEAAILQRRVFASDISPYATTLTRAKITPPRTRTNALRQLHRIFRRVEKMPLPDLASIPGWVRSFFHPDTLRETLRLAMYFKGHHHHFFLAALLGILHHQRPGFLSFPSSNLVPYLRTRRFPREQYPHLYEYRSVNDRLSAKVVRALKRPPARRPDGLLLVRRSSVENLTLPPEVDCVITSPPYMNALDYVRDNRLRLWFLGAMDATPFRETKSMNRDGYGRAMRQLASKLEVAVRPNGRCVFIVGEKIWRNGPGHPSDELVRVFSQHAPSFELLEVINDQIPDIRRARRNLAGAKRENVLIFQKRRDA